MGGIPRRWTKHFERKKAKTCGYSARRGV